MKEQMAKITDMVADLEIDVEKQASKNNKAAGVRVRVATNKIRNELKELKRQSMSLQSARDDFAPYAKEG